MMKWLAGGLSLQVWLVASANAACPAFPHSFSNGSTADANQINDNFNNVTTCFAPLANPSFTGNVGIGTTSPTQQLQLTGNALIPTETSGTVGNLFFSGVTLAGVNGLRLFANDSAGGAFIDVKASTTNNGLLFRVDTATGGVERMRINAAGNVGIGIAIPSYTLQVNGTAAGSQAWGRSLRPTTATVISPSTGPSPMATIPRTG